MNGSDLCDSGHQMSPLASDNTLLTQGDGDWQHDTKHPAFYEFISNTNYYFIFGLDADSEKNDLWSPALHWQN